MIAMLQKNGQQQNRKTLEIGKQFSVSEKASFHTVQENNSILYQEFQVNRQYKVFDNIM